MPEITIVVKVFVINSKDLILSLKRSADDQIRPSEWDLPGGGVDFGEDPTDAVIREAAEEAGLILKDPKLFKTKTTSDEKYVIRLFYYTKTDTDSVTLSSEHSEYKWVTKPEFDQLDIPGFYKDCLQYLFSDKV